MSYGIFPQVFRSISREQKSEIENLVKDSPLQPPEFEEKLRNLLLPPQDPRVETSEPPQRKVILINI